MVYMRCADTKTGMQLEGWVMREKTWNEDLFVRREDRFGQWFKYQFGRILTVTLKHAMQPCQKAYQV